MASEALPRRIVFFPGRIKKKVWPLVAERVIRLKELRRSRRMLTSPCTVREISGSSILAEQGGPIEFPILPPLRSLDRLTLRHNEQPWTSFRLRGVFSSLRGRLARKTRAIARLAGPVIIPRGLQGFTTTQDAMRRGATSPARAGCKFVSSNCWRQSRFSQHLRFRHTPRHELDRTVSSNWFFGRNWTTVFPRQTYDVNINTVTPNATVKLRARAQKPGICPSAQTGQGCSQSRPAGHWSISRGRSAIYRAGRAR